MYQRYKAVKVARKERARVVLEAQAWQHIQGAISVDRVFQRGVLRLAHKIAVLSATLE